MRKRTRTIVFAACIALFLLIAPVVVLYSQGYRFDFENKKIVRTGAFYFKVFPKNAEIYLNGKPEKKTSFLTGSALIENLLPKRYLVEIKKEDFHSWQKSLEIKEKQVTEAKSIVLFPEDPGFKELIKSAFPAQNVKEFWFSPDGKKILLLESEEQSWALKLYELDKNLKSHLIDEKDIYARGADLLKLEFFEDSKGVNLRMGIKEQEKDFILDLTRLPPVLTEKPTVPTQPVVPAQEMLALPENIVTFKKLNGQVYYLDQLGFVFRTDSLPPLQPETGTRINKNPFPIKAETKYALEVFSDEWIFLQEEKNLYLFNPDSESFEKFFDNISGLKISPDSTKLVLFSDSEIWILFLRDQDLPLAHKEGDRVFITRMAAKIGAALWLNSDYLIFNCGKDIKIVETDDRDKINMIDLAEFEESEIFWNQWDKKLYVFSDNSLYQSRALLP